MNGYKIALHLPSLLGHGTHRTVRVGILNRSLCGTLDGSPSSDAEKQWNTHPYNWVRALSPCERCSSAKHFLFIYFLNLFILSLMQQVRVSTGFVWYLLDPCRSGLTVWKDVLESIFHRFLGRLEKTVKMSEITQMKPETVKTGALHFK